MENEPKCDVDEYGTKRWYLNGKLHREVRPAVEFHDGAKYWFKHGNCHKLDGPAIIFPSGNKQWFINGSEVTTEIQSWADENDIDLDNLSDDDKLLIKLTWADYGK